MHNEYIIPFKGLKEGEHFFEYILNNRFFEGFEYGEIKKGNVHANVELVKHTRHLEFTFIIEGKVEITCDRCLDFFDIPIQSKNQLFVKFGEEHNEDDGEIIVLSYAESEINIAHYLYEFVHLSLPIQRIHPDNEDGTSTCNKEMLDILHKHEVYRDKKEDPVDPRWNNLRDLLNNN